MTLLNKADVAAAMAGMVGLAVRGIKSDDFLRYIGFDPDDLRSLAKEAADEEFATLPGMPHQIPAEGRLRKVGLSANQRAVVKEALVDTFVLAIETGVVLERARHEVEEAKS